MSWRSTLTSALGAAALAFCLSLAGARAAGAQGIESAIMPGEVIKGHADLEDKCDNCHVRFDPGAQPRLCLDCHKPVAADVRMKQGFHGRLKTGNCRECHTDHKGRNARIVLLDERKFDHARTDFLLRGKHADKPCKDCHQAGMPHRKAPSECVTCHREDDAHKGSLGGKCGNCHDENDWKKARFDHAKTRFPLRFAHLDAACTKCHADQRYANTPRDCLSCHRKDDAHKGSFGARCETCHQEAKWTQTLFRHDVDTRFRLLGKHQDTRCTACHTGPLYRQKTPTRCYDCHRKGDVHKRSLGEKCESCHGEKSWKSARFEHNRDTRFILRDKHATAKCASCHKPASPHEKLPTSCKGCHAEDDQKKGHKGRYGEKCESCHNEKAFKPGTFVHDRDTQYLLRGRHKQVKCDNCHKGPSIHDKLGTRCFTCHERDDLEKGHKGRYGQKCETCHIEKDFKTTTFDHDRDTVYPLVGGHRQAKCDSCHKEPIGSPRFDKRCITCHKDDDVHFGSYDQRCDQCHVTENWRKVIKRDGVR
jgi:hypothetical protein